VLNELNSAMLNKHWISWIQQCWIIWIQLVLYSAVLNKCWIKQCWISWIQHRWISWIQHHWINQIQLTRLIIMIPEQTIAENSSHHKSLMQECQQSFAFHHKNFSNYANLFNYSQNLNNSSRHLSHCNKNPKYIF